MLVRETCREALARGEGEFVLLVGDEPYYGPLGFARTVPGAIQFPGPVDPNRVLLHCPTIRRWRSVSAGPIAAFKRKGA